MGAGVAQQLERWTVTERSRVQVFGHGFKSRQERLKTLLLQSKLSDLFISVSVPPPCYCSGMRKILVIPPKVQVAGYS